MRPKLPLRNAKTIDKQMVRQKTGVNGKSGRWMRSKRQAKAKTRKKEKPFCKS